MWQKMVIVMIMQIRKGMKVMTVGQLIDGLKHYDSESDVTIFDNINDKQYDVSFIIEDEEKNLQVMIVFEGE